MMDWRELQQIRTRDNYQNQNVRPRTNVEGICLSTTDLEEDELDDIRRCFLRANRRVEGYLDCTELKVYMDLRRCPITQWEAEKLLEYSDPAYHYYISLSQILNLANLYGIGTSRPARMTKDEFQVAIKNSFQDPNNNENGNSVTNITNNFDFDGVMSYFEQNTIIENQNPTYPNIDREFTENSSRDELIKSTSKVPRKNRSVFRLWERDPLAEEIPPESQSTMFVVDQSSDTNIDSKSIPFNTLKESWEIKLKEMQEKNGKTISSNSYYLDGDIPPTSTTQTNFIIERKVFENQRSHRSTVSVATQTQLTSIGFNTVHEHRFSNLNSVFKVSLDNELTSRKHVAANNTSFFERRKYFNSPETFEINKAEQNYLKAPPLPNPIVPDIPIEWTSSERIPSW